MVLANPLGFQLVVTLQNGDEHDVTGHVMRPITTFRGRKSGAANPTESAAGNLSTTIWNPAVTGGHLWDELVEGSTIQLRVSDEVDQVIPVYDTDVIPVYDTNIIPVYEARIAGSPLWTGRIKEPRARDDHGYHTLALRCYGVLALLNTMRVTIATHASITIAQAFTELGDAAGAPVTALIPQSIAQMSLTNWQLDNEYPLAEARRLERLASGFLSETSAGQMSLNARTVDVDAATLVKEFPPTPVISNRGWTEGIRNYREIDWLVSGDTIPDIADIDIADVVEVDGVRWLVASISLTVSGPMTCNVRLRLINEAGW